MPIAPESFRYIKELVQRESAIQLESGKEYLVESRLLPLAREAGAPDVDAYIAKMRAGGVRQATKLVVEALTTNETSFFRDTEPFMALKTKVLPDLAEARATQRKIRLWSAASSSGQELYSMMISVKECPQMAGWKAEYFATDLSSEMVERTKAGRYNQLEMNRGMPAAQLVKYFKREGVDWVASEELRSQVKAQELNLNKPFPPLGTFDVIFLRNVLIYFDVPTKRAVLQRMRQVLAKDGFLLLGTAETVQGVDDSWERIPVGRSALYRPKRS